MVEGRGEWAKRDVGGGGLKNWQCRRRPSLVYTWSKQVLRLARNERLVFRRSVIMY